MASSSNSNVIDLRSDTVTRPSAAMYQAMAESPVGDDVYGEDETVNKLEAKGAEITGKQAAIFFSSATQANLAAILTHCGRGEEVISGDLYHVIIDEAGGASALGGVVIQPLATNDMGGLTVDQVVSAVKEDDFHSPMSRMLSLENTVSGQVQSLQNQKDLAEAARNKGLVVHLDGARMMNACVALGATPETLSKPFDSVMICLSKGLGSPVGALLCGDELFVRRARRLRKMLGGGMRQVGILAACGLYALNNNIERLAEDHDKAERLFNGLGSIEQLKVRHATNMVFVEPPENDRDSLVASLADAGIRIGAPNPVSRLVVHLDISNEDIDRVIEAYRRYFS